MGRRVHVKTNDIMRFDCKIRIVGQLELFDAVRLQPMAAPNPLHRTHANAGLFRHCRRSPMGNLAGRGTQGRGDDVAGNRGV